MKKSTLKSILIAVTVVALIAAGILAANVIERKSERAPEGAGTTTFSTVREGEANEAAPDYDAETRVAVNIGGKTYYQKENISTLLMMGVDDMELEEYTGLRNYALADFLVLAIFDDTEKTCTLLQINRNTMTDVPVLGADGRMVGTTNEQICYAHTYGDGMEQSCENTVNTVSSLLYGVPIDNYLSLTMASITAINDTVGGVTVTIEDDFSGADDTLIQGETVTLMGEHAFHYVHDRFGMTDDSNTSRMRRQATYMTALVDKLREKMEEDSSFILELYDAVADYLVTDCDINELNDYSVGLYDYSLGDIVTPEGESIHGTYTEFYVDEDALRDLVTDLFYVPADDQVEEDEVFANATVENGPAAPADEDTAAEGGDTAPEGDAPAVAEEAPAVTDEDTVPAP